MGSRLHRIPRYFRQTDELKPGGANIEVTNENKEEYIRLYAEHRFTHSIKRQFDRVIEGLKSVVPLNLLSTFDQAELQVS